MADTQASPAADPQGQTPQVTTPETEVKNPEIIESSGEIAPNTGATENYLEDDSDNDEVKERTKKRFEDMKDNYNKVISENQSYKSKIEELEAKIEDISQSQKTSTEDEFRGQEFDKKTLQNELESLLEKRDFNNQMKSALEDLGLNTQADRENVGKKISRNTKELARIHGVSIKEATKMAFDILHKTKVQTPEEKVQLASASVGGGSTIPKTTPDVLSNSWVTKGIDPKVIASWKQKKAAGKF